VSSAPRSVCGAFDPWRASPLRRARIGWGAEGLIIGAAEAVGLLPMFGQERCDYLVRFVVQLSAIV
jgi:hypothetical protein